MESIHELFRIGHGPSSSHTMGPRRAAEAFSQKHPEAVSFRVTLYGTWRQPGVGI
jgi:L-serine dehydratase